MLILNYGHETCRRNHKLQCGTEILCHGTEYMLLECNEKGRWHKNLSLNGGREVWDRRPGALLKKRGMQVVEGDCRLCKEWLLSQLPSDTSRKRKKTLWHTAWNDGSLDSIVVGFEECFVSNGINVWWKIMMKISLLVTECWQWLVNSLMMCIIYYSSYSYVLTVMFI